MLCRCIRRVSLDGIITTVAGTGSMGYSGDGGLANLAQLSFPSHIAFASDGSLYFVDGGTNTINIGRLYIRRVDVDGIITTVAGAGVYGHTADGEPAVTAMFEWISDIAVHPDGRVYFIEGGSNYSTSSLILSISVDGTLATMAGTGEDFPNGCFTEQGPAGQVRLGDSTALEFGPEGSLYFATTSCEIEASKIYRLSPDGIITVVAGGSGSSSDGLPATQTSFYNFISGLAFGLDDSLYISQYERWTYSGSVGD